uniref:Activator of basal transcription 1 n=1 Tax=Anopheles minimus TaxID=112268 RepID=A0A182VY07_9DIPT
MKRKGSIVLIPKKKKRTEIQPEEEEDRLSHSECEEDVAGNDDPDESLSDHSEEEPVTDDEEGLEQDSDEEDNIEESDNEQQETDKDNEDDENEECSEQDDNDNEDDGTGERTPSTKQSKLRLVTPLPKKKERKAGVIYICSIPKHMNVTVLRTMLEQFGEIGRIYLKPALKDGKVRKKNTTGKKVVVHYTEGWVEFLDKRVAKAVVPLLNMRPITNKKQSVFRDILWSMKYLSGFHCGRVRVPVNGLVLFEMSPTMVESDLSASFQELLDAIKKVHPSDRALYDAFAPVRKRIWRKWCLRKLSVVVCLTVICVTVCYVPSVNWHVTAIGRLLMIEILPYWDWTPLYRGKCLIAKAKEMTAAKQFESTIVSFPDDCVVCRNFGLVPVRQNVTYESLYRHHLMRNLPTIVSDVYPPWSDHKRYGSDWDNFLNDLEELLLANPCDFRTNLIFKPSFAKTSALARMVDLLADEAAPIGNATNRGWFVQLRNCALRTIKKTRTMFEKPYFYATHWEPPYTNWILLSRAFEGALEMTPNMAGLVLVHQLRSSLNVILRPRAECENSCQMLRITLQQQQSLLFSTTLWNFSYIPSDGNETSVTFITETYENV